MSILRNIWKLVKGTYSCLCDSEMVDWSAANGDRPGTDCQERIKTLALVFLLSPGRK